MRLRSLFVVAIAMLSGAAAAQVAPTPAVIPQPQRLELREGRFVLDAHTRIDAPADARSQEIAAWLAQALAADTGIATNATTPVSGVIRLRLRPSIDGEEAYRLAVEPRRVVIEASTLRGLFWGAQTLRQLLPASQAVEVAIPALRIEDAPQFAYRGHMLDVGRHFMPVEFVKKQIDLLSYYKLNTFRWHLTEDQGWRIEIRKYPRLTEVGAWRTEPDGSRYGGYYTQAQIRDVVEYARQRNIMVIPEIEMPGHATAALAAYPALSCHGRPVEVSNSWGVKKDILCAGDDAVFAFVQDVLDEVIDLFPAPYVHIGGDEVPKEQWQASAASRQRMRQEGLKDEHELQAYFIRRVQRYLASKGRTLIGWDEILEGGADANAIVEVWRGEEAGARALANGNRIVSAGPFYLDSPLQSLTLEKIYATDIVPPAYAAHRDRVLGAEAPLWTERVTPVNAESMLYPRLLAFSEATWSGAPRDFADFRRRLGAHYPRLRRWQVAYGPEDRNVVDLHLAWDAAAQGWQVQAERGLPELQLHYTLDGSEPLASSPAFTDSLTLRSGATLAVAPYLGERPYVLAQRFATVRHAGLGKSITYSTPPHRNYRPAGDAALVDGLLGGDSHADGLWSAWQGEDLTATLDLERKMPVSAIRARFLQQSGSWIELPRAVRYLVSRDGVRWKQVHEQRFDVDAGDDTRRVVEAGVRLPKPVRARFVRMEVDRYGRLPDTHPGAGSEAFFFVDELVVE